MGNWKIIGGVIIGVGAVAAAPFTGGGSLLGAASLAGSLAGTTAAASAVAAGVAGGVAGAVISEEEKKRKKAAEKNHFEEGTKAGEEKVMERFSQILKTMRKRDEFILLVVKIGTHVSKCDGDFSPEERKEIDNFKGNISEGPIIPEVIKNRINAIIESDISFNEIVSDTKEFIKDETHQSRIEILSFIDNLIQRIVYSDGIRHQKEEEFIVMWNKEFRING